MQTSDPETPLHSMPLAVGCEVRARESRAPSCPEGERLLDVESRPEKDKPNQVKHAQGLS